MSRHHDQQFNQFIDEPIDHDKLIQAIVIAAFIVVAIIGAAVAVVTYYSFW